MAINFPNTPTVGDIHIENGNRFRWDGSGWIAIQEDATAIGDTPPSNPSPGDIWFDSANALLFIWYNDGNSQQWVNVTAGSVNPLWQTNSGDIYFDTGNVGIGTNTPASALDVNGNITVSGTVDGRDIANDGTKLDGIASGAQVNTVDKVGTPADNQIGVWTGDGTIEGASNLTWDGSVLTVGNTGAVQLPVGTTAQQPTPAAGMLRYNSDESRFEGYTTSWEAIIPAGAVMAYAMTTAPNGWLECDGSAVSRTTYAALFSAIGTTYGNGDGSTTFNLPDLRGEFVRGWDNGRGVDGSRALGSSQLDQMQRITGDIPWNSAIVGAQTEGAFSVTTGNPSRNAINVGLSIGSFDSAVDFDSANSPTARTGDETRPRNVALMYCIKY